VFARIRQWFAKGPVEAQTAAPDEGASGEDAAETEEAVDEEGYSSDMPRIKTDEI
jgi:hypothetical protein